jgi:hypothetical protein
MMQEECAMLWRLDNFIITAIDNEPTNLGVKYISDSNDIYKPENDSISTFLLKPGNHKITYYYHYEKFLKMNDPRFSMDKGSSRYFEKLGELNFNFEKGKYYIISIDDETGNFDLGEHNWVYWESILNKYIKVSIREYLFKKQKK